MHAVAVLGCVALFLMAGVCEIGGGWRVIDGADAEWLLHPWSDLCQPGPSPVRGERARTVTTVRARPQ
jgi:hypothetical protein